MAFGTCSEGSGGSVASEHPASGERVVLRDGSVVRIRPIQPGDARLLADGFARLSGESRRLRFLSPKAELSPAELRYFTEIDHHNHEALGALNERDGRGLGVARFVRDVKDPEAAEVAVTVVDHWQHRGLGTELVRRLAQRAAEEGVRRFTALVAFDNPAVEALLRAAGGEVRVVHREAGIIEYDIRPAPKEGVGLHRLLRALGARELLAPKPIREILATLVPDRFTTDGG